MKSSNVNKNKSQLAKERGWIEKRSKIDKYYDIIQSLLSKESP